MMTTLQGDQATSGDLGETGGTTLDVVIVTARGSLPYVGACLDSLHAHQPSRGEMHVHVVDNSSGDGTVDAIRADHPWVTVTELNRNAGFAAANNVAFRAGCAPYCLVLNPDTEMRPGALDLLIELMERHPQAAAVGCRLAARDGTADHNAKRAFPTPLAAFAHFTGLSRFGPLRTWFGVYDIKEIPDDGAGPVDAVSGACMLVRRAALEEVGVFDEGYWMYGEDLDWCYRFHRAGWEVRYDGSASIYHAKHGLTGRHRRLRENWAFHRSMGRFYRKFQGGSRPAVDFAVYSSLLVKFVFSALRSAMMRDRRA
jgi:hypothetical protein